MEFAICCYEENINGGVHAALKKREMLTKLNLVHMARRKADSVRSYRQVCNAAKIAL